MKRGELWVGAGARYASKPRPVLIVQDDAFAEIDSVTVVPLTTTKNASTFLRVPIAANASSGLTSDSFAMVDKLSTLQRTGLTTKIGTASSTQLVEIERALLTFLGLAR